MKPTDLLQLIVARFKAGILRPVHIEGSPGMGKTEITEQAAKQLNVAFRVLDATLMQAEDCGLPIPNADRTSVNFIVPEGLFPLVGSDCPDTGILVIEELAGADNSVQKALRNLVQARRIQGRMVKPGWLIITTGNRASDRAGAARLLSHMANSLTRVTLEVSLEDWTQWALTNSVKPEVISFCRQFPELLSKFDANADAFPSPRSWVQGVSAALGVVPAHLEYAVYCGDVGEGAAATFTGYLRTFRSLTNPDVVLMHPDTAEVPKESSARYAMISAMSFRTTKDNFGRVMKYISRFPEEFGLLFIRDTIVRCPSVQESTDFIAWASGPGAKLLL